MKKLPALKQLQHLLALHVHQHFGRAAAACFISQSTLSASIGQLEAMLELPLLERDHKSFIFTAAGKEIVERSKEIIQNCSDLVDSAKNNKQPMQGNLSIGCIPTIAPFILTELLAASSKIYPALSIFLREDTTDSLLNQLSLGKLDLLILAFPLPVPEFSSMILAEDPFHLVWSAERFKDEMIRDMDSWPDKSIFLLDSEHCLTRHTLQACHLKASEKIHPFFSTSLHTLIQMVQSEKGITWLPELAIHSGILKESSLHSRVMDQANASRKIGIVWRNAFNNKETISNFALLLKNVLIKKLSQTQA